VGFKPNKIITKQILLQEQNKSEFLAGISSFKEMLL
jgi:hypothetical protein